MSLHFQAKCIRRSLNSCLISLPSSFIYPILDSTNLLVQNIILKLSDARTGKHIVTVGWNGNTCNVQGAIEIDQHYADILKIGENSMVNVEIDLSHANSPRSIAATIEIEPLTTADWELTEIYAQLIENNFLSQVRCVSTNQTLLVHANPSSSTSAGITFKVKTIKTASKEVIFATIGNDTELHIIPKPHNHTPAQSIAQPHLGNGRTESKSQKKRSVSSKTATPKASNVIRRAVVLEKVKGVTIFNPGKEIDALKHSEYVRISTIEGPGTEARAKRTSHKEVEMGLNQDTFGKAIIAKYSQETLDAFHNPQILGSTLFISQALAISLGLEGTCGELICVEPYGRKDIRLDLRKCLLTIEKLTTTSETSLNLNQDNRAELKNGSIPEKRLKEYENGKVELKTIKQLLLNQYGRKAPLTDGTKLPIVEGIFPEGAILRVSGPITKSSSTTGVLNWTVLDIGDYEEDIEVGEQEILTAMNIELGSKLLVPRSRVQKVLRHDDVDVYGQEKKINQIEESLRDGVPTFLYGKSGSGKTTICKYLARQFHDTAYYTKLVDFDKVGNANDKGGKNGEDGDIEENVQGSGLAESKSESENTNKSKFISAYLDKIARECVWRSPSLLILDNIDKVLGKDVEHGESGDSSQLTEILVKKLDHHIKNGKIALLITGQSRDTVNQLIFQRHLVDEEIGLEAPNKHQLAEILNKMILKKFSKYYDKHIVNQLVDITSELEGYLPLDVEILLDRAFHNMVTEDDEKLSVSHFMAAIDGYTPTSLRGVKLQKSTTNWSDIGGLIEVKKILLETLEWPTKYAPIFEKCTLRLRSGILLYGYPGCGKTMLASAISSQCGLNFISVKGPEILNKYIGASEQTIRELFERAQSAKPCILFFDEFDSIAPKRGHDSTGVTDRIVNQLLTQMDGAEGLEGVYVLAATSRLDLIDSALLRPGRLDKSVICELPDLQNREDILQTIVQSNGFHLANDKDLSEVARLTNGYTGADLQAVVYNAYLKGVHVSLDQANDQNYEKDKIGSGGDHEDGPKFRMLKSTVTPRQFKTIEETRQVVETVSQRRQSVNHNLSSSVDSGTHSEVTDPSLEAKPLISITLEQLQESLKETKCSISQKELEKLQGIYSQFESSKRPGEMKDGEGSTNVGVRATLM